MEEITKKINDTKFNRILKMKNLVYNITIDENVFEKKFKVCKKTIRKWKKKMALLEKIEKVNIDRALSEMIFKNKAQILCFEFMKKDLNFFSTYEEVNKEIVISRYFYKTVKKYILEEIEKID